MERQSCQPMFCLYSLCSPLRAQCWQGMPSGAMGWCWRPPPPPASTNVCGCNRPCRWCGRLRVALVCQWGRADLVRLSNQLCRQSRVSLFPLITADGWRGMAAATTLFTLALGGLPARGEGGLERMPAPVNAKIRSGVQPWQRHTPALPSSAS